MRKFTYNWLHIRTGETGTREIECVTELDFLRLLNSFNRQDPHPMEILVLVSSPPFPQNFFVQENIMNTNTTFSLELLRLARIDAKAYNVTIPKRLVALQSSRNQWFVQGIDDRGEYVSASDAYEARANYISLLIRRQHPQLEETL